MRKTRVSSVIFICGVLLYVNVNGQQNKSFLQTSTGIDITIRHSFSGIKKIRLQPLSDQIIHVTQIATDDFSADRSLMAIQQSNAKTAFTVKADDQSVVLSTAT